MEIRIEQITSDTGSVTFKEIQDSASPRFGILPVNHFVRCVAVTGVMTFCLLVFTTPAQASFHSSDGTSYSFVTLSSDGCAGNIIGTIDHRIASIESSNIFADEEDHASPAAIIRAKVLLSELGQDFAKDLADADIAPFDGSIRIVWTRGKKTLKIIIPKSQDRPCYIYYQDQTGHGIEDEPNLQTVKSRIAWISSVNEYSAD